MKQPLLASLSVGLYLAAAALIAYRLFMRDRASLPPRSLALGAAFAGLLLHTAILYQTIFSPAGLNLAFFNALSLASWTVIGSLLVPSINKPVENLGIVLLPVAALTVLMDAVYPHVGFMGDNASWVLKLHVLLSMLAYSMLTIASVQAILLAVQDHYLRKRQPNGFIRSLPPLMTMEALLFEMITVGFVLLTLALVSGFAFLENMFAQHLVHKTVLSVFAWMVFGGLLLGRKLWGWRGRKAITWTLSGFIILLLAYFGSKMVLEIILNRTAGA
ncbi:MULTISPECIES: cytochrome C assembly family protein [Thiorhodovibrio]|uniref:cytochrome C assembly family protein n=1 Tax=Thiorhodovibrio TaxID=61593 RepID=UPI0019113F02|nr:MULTISPECIES: cytochrome c biogenesis protein CcsA [Thiorhodovibrio]MBK5970637.1 cytochrome C biogenesis protein [Thiorhodovibrio winogradskyi]WPL12453.1 Inner membrane protein YpjD [Thiorhodovibrio litoralis]